MTNQNIGQKPKWTKKPEDLDFKVVNQPLEEAYKGIVSTLEKETSEPKKFYFILKSLLTANFRNYMAIRRLVVKKPKLTFQAYILTRPIIDSVFTFVALVSNPQKYIRQFELAGYRQFWETYKREEERYSKDNNWKNYLEEKKRYIEHTAALFGLSSDEKERPDKNIKYWPIPSQMLRRMKLPKENIEFLEEVYQWRYRELSSWSHLQWEGVALDIFASLPEVHWHPGKFESDAVYTGLLFLLMLLSEIEGFKKYGFNKELKYIWTVLGNYYDEAKDYYDLRYSKLLD